MVGNQEKEVRGRSVDDDDKGDNDKRANAEQVEDEEDQTQQALSYGTVTGDLLPLGDKRRGQSFPCSHTHLHTRC